MRTEKIERTALVRRTVDLLRNRPRTLTTRQIEKDTGISRGWLVNLMSTDGDPSANRIVRLYEYLTKSELLLK